MSTPACASGRRKASSPSFLGWPAELRVKVYEYLLVASEPIIVCSATLEEDVADEYHNMSSKSIGKVEVCPAILDRLTLSTLYCNRQISTEAAATLYGRNTFAFEGQNTWSPLYEFLRMIGGSNRSTLRNLEVDVPFPRRLWQYSSGTCTTLDRWCLRKVIAQPQYFQSSSIQYKEGFVDCLDPAIEPCFRLLGNKNSPLIIRLNLQRYYLPGLEVPGDGYDATFQFALELPTMIDRYITAYTSSSSAGSQVNVEWQGECSKDQFLGQTQSLQDSGWIIDDTQETSIAVDRGRFTVDTMRFSLRWKS